VAGRAQAIDGLDVQTEIALDPTVERFDAELESTIYRVVQEALTNVSRHAQATRAVVSLGTGGNGSVRVTVTDDGRGLPDSSAFGHRGAGLEGGFGLSGMREAAGPVRGRL